MCSSDLRAAGRQYLCFEELHNEVGERLFGPANSSLSFQAAQIKAGEGVVPVSIILFSDATYAKKRLPYRPIYCKSIQSKLQCLH